MRESAKKRYKVGCFAAYRENSLQSERLHFRQGEKPLFSGGWPSIGGPEPSGYIEPQGGKLWKGGQLMSDFEMLSIVLMILGIVVTLVIAYVQGTKK